MIDLHSHLLPSIDDGAATIEESREMLARFAQAGFTHLVTTPHLQTALDVGLSTRIERALDDVRQHAREFGLTIGLGFEHLLQIGTVERLERGEPSRLDGSGAVLVEFPAFTWPGFAESALFEMQIAGFAPVLAHPERYPQVQDDPDLALDVAERGVVLQVTTASLVGALGSAAQKTSRTLLQRSLERQTLVILASDAHSPGRRLSQLTTGLNWIRQNYKDGNAVLNWTTNEVPSALLGKSANSNDLLDQLRNTAPPPDRARVRRFWFS